MSMERTVHTGVMLIVAAAAVAMYWLARRKGWTLIVRRYVAGRFLPSSAPSASRTARIVEAIILGASATAIIAVVATCEKNGGLMLVLDKLQPPYPTANIIMFACAVIGAAVAMWITFRGRTGAGAITMAVVLIGYGFMLKGGRPGSWFLPTDMMVATARVTEYTINVSNADIPGAELWVNGVSVGALPYKTTPDAFFDMVPEWRQPPDDYETSKTEIPGYELWGASRGLYKKYIPFDLPPLGGGSKNTVRDTCFYAQVRYAGEWALAGGSSGGGSSGGKYRRTAESHFGILLPQRAGRLATLLNKARLAGYRVDEEWLKAVETYNRDGWNALVEAAGNEPEMRRVLIAWATWRRHLADVVDDESAWGVFQEICDSADAAGHYSTNSVDGLAVECLVPQMSARQLVALAEETIRKTKDLSYSYSHGQAFGRPWFATYRSAGNSVPPHAFVIAHAVWKLNEHLGTTHDANLVQERVVPALLCWRPNLDKAAVSLGGPIAYTWLIRHDWRTPGEALWRSSSGDDVEWVHGMYVNRWLLRLAKMPGVLGRDFRSENSRDLFRLADALCTGPLALTGIDPPSFLFMDLGKGRKSLAARYWPTFRGHAVGNHYQPLQPMWRYLAKMEPVSTVEQYVEAYRSVPANRWKIQFAVSELKALPSSKRKEVIAAIRAEVEGDLRYAAGGVDEFYRKRILRELDLYLPAGAQAERILGSLTNKGEGDFSPTNVALWLEHTRPDHPLVELLATSEDLELRLMAMGALREYPTPGRQRLLQQLLEDPSSTVRASARDVDSHLQALAAESPSRYASDPPSSAAVSATAPTGGDVD